MKKILIIVVLVVANAVFAGNPNKISLTSTTSTNFSTGTSSVTHTFYIDGEKKSVGYLGNGLLPYLKNDQEAYDEMLKYQKKRTNSIVGYSCVFGGIALAMAIGLNNETDETYYNYETGKIENKKEINPPALIGIGLALGGLFYGGANYFSANQHVGKSVEIYNSNLDNKSDSTLDMKFMPTFRQNSIWLCCAVNW